MTTAKRSASSRRPKRPRARQRAIVYLNEKDLAYVVHRIAQLRFTEETYGEPMPPFELLPGRLGLLQSALAAPRWQYHETIHEKAAALFRSIVKNHALRDGNKRLGVTALDVFLRINRVDLKVGQQNLVDAAMFLATYEGNFPVELLARWIRAGCSGRPRRIVGVLADEWPETRAVLMNAERSADRRAGRSPRVPGQRVRRTAAYWRLITRTIAEAQQQRLPMNGAP